MDNFKAIYKILTTLERAMDLPEFDIAEIAPEALKVSNERFCRYLEMLQDSGLVKGVNLFTDITGQMQLKNSKRIRITLSGLEYLQENSTMKKIYNAAKGVTDLLP